MKQFILVLMLIIIASSETVKPSADTMCACDKIKSQADCKNVSTCAWTATVPATDTTPAVAGSCGTPTTPTTPTPPPAHCPQVIEPATNCWKTLGCAYVDSKCTHFTGCTAYVKTANSDCQAISKLCITDGTQCTDAKSCNEYTLETQCKTNASISGILKCKWENSACRDYSCSEADNTLSTDESCIAWMSTCLFTTGKGCTTTKVACSSYPGDLTTCAGLIGLDGKCEGTEGGTNCSAKVCSGASKTITTDDECKSYQIGCVTTGKGCSTTPLPLCATYLGDNTTCVGYIGFDGVCEGDSGATNCRSKQCKNAPPTYNTNDQCIGYKTGCVTNGKGCADSLTACATLGGTAALCNGYFGSDGTCTLVGTTCTAKACKDAVITLTTDDACNAYSKGCITIGKGCTKALGLCSSYVGTATVTCDGLIGIDGKCKGPDSTGIGSCSKKTCSDAPTSNTTNAQCKTYSPDCVSTGAGCTDIQICSLSQKQISCEGNSICSWKNTCVSNTSCTQFKTASICSNNKAISGTIEAPIQTPCFWSSGSCRNLKCEDAGSSYITNDQCDAFMKGCVTNNKGCYSLSTPCSSYYGTKTTCESFKRKCSQATGVTSESTACVERTCQHNTDSTSDDICNNFLQYCRTNGKGCVVETTQCSDYKGSRDQCDKFRQITSRVSDTKFSTTRCYNSVGVDETTSCTIKQCSDNTDSTSDDLCKDFLEGCLTNGKGCISNTSNCTLYKGTQDECGKFKGYYGLDADNKAIYKGCWNVKDALTTASCKVKECTDATTDLKENDLCGSFLAGCLTNGGGCVAPNEPCSSYRGTLDTCTKFLGNSLQCYNVDTCTVRLCADVKSPLDNKACTEYLSTCRYFKGKCVNASACTGYTNTSALSLPECQDVYDDTSSTAMKCWWDTGLTCTARTCGNATSPTKQADCESHFPSGCIYGNGKCQIKNQTCSQFKAETGTPEQKLADCNNIVDKDDKKCGYSSSNSNFCAPRTCDLVSNPKSITDCETYLPKGCQFNGSKCVPIGSCTSYLKTAMDTTATTGLDTDDKIRGQCEKMVTNSDPATQCTFKNGGSNCVDKTCETASLQTSLSQTVCDSHLDKGCAYNESCLKQKCQRKTGASSNTNCTDHDSRCRYNGNSVCIAQQANCSDYLIDISKILLADKQGVCNLLSNSAGEMCKYPGTGFYCSAKVCADGASVGSQSDCLKVLSSCRWLGGSTCSDVNTTCLYTSVTTESTTCPTLTDSLGNYCVAGTSGLCAAKLCTAATGMTSNTTCITYKPTCRWIGGTSCVEATKDCTYTVTGDAYKICPTLTDLSGTDLKGINSCYADSATTCKGILCSSKTDAASQADCLAIKPTCRWLGGTTCAEANTDCVYAVTSGETTCPTLTDISGKVCMNNGGTACQAQTTPSCNIKGNATSQADCLAVKSTCRWLGGSGSTCVEARNDCNYTITTGQIAGDVCPTLTDSLGNICMDSGLTEKCFGKCSSKINATSQADCLAVKWSCRWLGGTSTCVDANDTCIYTVIGDIAQVCPTLTDNVGNTCVADTGQVCKAKKCSDATSMDSVANCISYKPSCMWNGVASGSCVEAEKNCLYFLTVQNCPSLKDSSGKACIASSRNSQVCEDNCAATNGNNQADCLEAGASCRWIGGTNSACQLASNDCVYTVTSEATTCLTLTDLGGFKCVAGSPGKCRAFTTCADKPGATRLSDCTEYHPSCQWLGTSPSSCVDANADCKYTVASGTASTVCPTMKNIQGKACISGIGDVCTNACADILNATSQESCLRRNPNCRWLGGSTCADSQNTCAYTVTGSASSVCQSLTDKSGSKCQQQGSTQTCEARTCAGKIDPNSKADCQNWKQDCKFMGGSNTTCSDIKSDCSYSVIPTSGQQAICEGLVDTSRNKCQYSGSGQLCQARTCAGNTTATTTDACKAWKSDCEWLITKNGCADPNSCKNCLIRTCDNIQTPPTEAKNCTDWNKDCRFTGKRCVPVTTCDKYDVQEDDTKNSATCLAITDSNGNLCNHATTETVCKPRACADKSNSTDCLNYMKSCRWNGNACQDQNSCGSYTVSTSDDSTLQATNCRNLTDTNKKNCGYASAGTCADRSCSNITPLPDSDQKCKDYLPDCRFSKSASGNKCLDKTSDCTSYYGTAAECKLYIGVSGTQPCWSTELDGAAAKSCIVRTCDHNTTAVSNDECDKFLSTCRTKGTGCVSISTDCSTFSGNKDTCSKFLAKDSKTDRCKVITDQQSSNCKERKCSDNATATLDGECDQFQKNCVTNGAGCVPDTLPCSQYQGVQQACDKFKGSKDSVTKEAKRCWNTATAEKTDFCIEKKCSDDTTSTSDGECESSLTGCVTKGTGCIEKTALCTQYVGTQTVCAKFKGNQTSLCWNTKDALETSSCKVKECSDNTNATTDADCDTFLPKVGTATNPQCITKGTGCVTFGQLCSYFKGTEEECSKFTASNGPCTTSATGSVSASGACIPRVCSDALNTLITDEACKKYHPTCVTNGYGCVLKSDLACDKIIEKASCSAASSGCAWVNNCQTSVANCSDLTSAGASTCINTPVTSGAKCAWSGTACRNQVCSDLPASLMTDDACSKAITGCTTKESGCVVKGICSSYLTEVICKAAKTTSAGDTCIWGTNPSACRPKQCTDGIFTTDALCNGFLSGCKTNGTSCISGGQNCTTLQNATVCQVDGTNSPCLWVNNSCHNYAKCGDITLNSHSECQKFSTLCTTDGTKCIAITTCANSSQPSCITGTDGTCGWLPSGTCKKFGACADATGTDTPSCQLYGSNCITDGTKCIDKGLCSSYLTQPACDQLGTDGTCQFANNSCRLRECSDATGDITTHTGCYSFTAKTKCTTNGTSCVVLSTCASYTIEVGCILGTEGTCTYGLPVGETTGNKACRQTACADLKQVTSALCGTKATENGITGGCVSDGTNCIVKTTCAAYTSKEACNGGGSDGQCAFTPGSATTPNVGTCKLMSACTDANNDQIACNNKPTACMWSSSTSGTTTTTSCASYTCATKGSVNSCSPVPSFDLSTYTVCGPATTGGCTEVAGSTLLTNTCQSYTLKTYTWNETTNACTACFTSTNTDPVNNGETGGSTTTDGNIIKSIATLVILAIIVT